jgi:hypothetical protein
VDVFRGGVGVVKFVELYVDSGGFWVDGVFLEDRG